MYTARARRLSATAVAAIAALLTFAAAIPALRQRRIVQEVHRAARADYALPDRVLWVWERPEDLRAIDPARTGVAVLEETLLLGDHVTVRPRRQPIALPGGTRRIAVVRIETERTALLRHRGPGAAMDETLDRLTAIAKRPGLSALQIDFDARKSERGFYRDLLTALRARMPADLPLEMTALVSWCANDGWLEGLPVNRAVPMFFRMEPDRRLRGMRSGVYRVTEPLCRDSVGVSTGEPWPPDAEGKRHYIFADGGWRRDVSWLAEPERSHEAAP